MWFLIQISLEKELEGCWQREWGAYIMNQGAWYKLQSSVMCAEGNGGTLYGVTEAAGTRE